MYKKWNRKVLQIEKCFLCGLMYLSGGFLMVCLLLMISAWGVILFFEKNDLCNRLVIYIQNN